MHENPYKPFRRVLGAVDSAKRVTDERFGAWELGYNARCPEGWIVVRLDEHEERMRECEALRIERDYARGIAEDAEIQLERIAALADAYAAELDEAINLGNDLADSIEELRAVITAERVGRWKRASERVVAWRAVSGSSEPRKEA